VTPEAAERPAGDIGVWLGQISRAITGDGESDVPCGECTACCSAAQFVHVGPDERDALARIPVELLFPAPGLPPGHQLLGYDQAGRCPMLGALGCTIYDARPRACRVYDCRVFAITGVVPDEPGRTAVATRVAQWRFAVSSDDDQLRWDAVRAAAEFLATYPSTTGMGSTARALAALRVHPLFIEADRLVTPSPEAVLTELAAHGE